MILPASIAETAMARLGLFNYKPDVVDASAENR